MSRHKQKRWSLSQMKDRGWTSALAKELLPQPRCVSAHGKSVRLWERAAVLDAEKDPRFIARAEQFRREQGEDAALPADRAAALLDEAWQSAERDDTLADLLASHYHRAIAGGLRGSPRKRPRMSQASGYFGEFLALEQKPAADRTPELLRRFRRAAPWLEDDAPVHRRVLAHYPAVLRAVSRRIVEEFLTVRSEADLHDLLTAKGFPFMDLLKSELSAVWSVWYVPRAIRTSLSMLVALHPRDEYPEARAMRRHFILHLGGTNTGKTYAGFQRLIQAPTGVYLAPLRLLALEAQETMLSAGVECGLTTGEEEDRGDWDTHIAATAEKLELRARYDVAVIDECQMIADRQRGYAWTRAILGVLAPEIHLCAAPEAKDLLLRLIEDCGDTVEVELHRRMTPLVCMRRTVDFEHVQPGDALITFSKLGVLSVAEDLRQAGKEPAIIYGALPYSTRRRQMEGFLEGKMRYVVATDAIGMGLNLPIRRIIFMDTEKFDGVERRPLKPSEIQQIAGRAGRYGMYDKGYVGATENLAAIRMGLNTTVPPLQYAIAGFSDLILQVDFDLLEVLTQWNAMPAEDPYVKLDVTRYITVISKMREMGFLLTKEQELRAANIPFDETEEPLRELFFEFLRTWQAGEDIQPPGLPPEKAPTLPELELQYRKLDLYFSFAKAFECPIDEDKLYESREMVADEINEILLHRLRSNIRFCAKCGAPLPLHHRWRVCENCYRREYMPPPWKRGGR